MYLESVNEAIKVGMTPVTKNWRERYSCNPYSSYKKS